MGWYLCQDGRSDGPYSDQIIQSHLQAACQSRPSLPRYVRWMPFVTSLRHAILVGISATLIGWLIARHGLEALLYFPDIQAGTLVFLSTWLIAITGIIWAWSGLWRLSYRHKHTTCYRWHSLSAAAISLGLLLYANGFAFEQAVLWLKTAPQQIRFQIGHAGRLLILSGNIGTTATQQLEHMLTRYPNIQTIRLSLTGGVVEEAKKMQMLIRHRRLNTYVADDCSSACTIVFMGGTQRFLRRGARLGFHRYQYLGLSPEAANHQDLVEQAYLMSLGLPRPFTQRIFSTHAPWYPSTEELTAAHIVTHILETDISAQQQLP